MFDVILASFGVMLIKAPIALAGLFLYLRLADRMAGIEWRKAFDSIESDARACATYFAARNLGACYLLAELFS